MTLTQTTRQSAAFERARALEVAATIAAHIGRRKQAARLRRMAKEKLK